MKSSSRQSEWADLPSVAYSSEGAEFDPRRYRWHFRSGVRDLSIDFSALEECSTPLLVSFRRLLLWYVENRSAALAEGVFQRFLHFVRSQPAGGAINEVTADQLLSYRASLAPDRKWYLTTLAGAFRRWNDLGYSGLNPDVNKLLKQLKLRGNRKGEAVRTACPVSGPLTDIEFAGVVAAAKASLEQGKLAREQFLLLWLCISFGMRPTQIAALKTCDLILIEGANGGAALRVPRAKQPGKSIRSEFRERPLVAELALMLQMQIKDVEARLSCKDCPSGLPLFPAATPADSWALGFEWHLLPGAISRRVSACLEGLNVYSERTGLPLKLGPVRLRRTIGTRAAAEGRGVMVIAELLDHSDLQSVGVYVEARPDIIDRLTEAMASALAPLAQAFAGELVDPETDVLNPGGRIADPRFGSRKPLGKCGASGACKLAAPTGCYTCHNFRAWRDGPHRAVLSHLLAERARLKEVGDLRIAAVNDRAILAVAEVVALCAEAENG
jgi:integrase